MNEELVVPSVIKKIETENILFQLKNGVVREHLKKLSKQTATNSFISLFLIIIVTFVLFPYAPHTLLFTWSLLHAAIFTIILFRWYGAKGKDKKASKPDISLSKKGLYHAMLWALVSGGFWGALTMFIPNSPPFVQLGLILLMGGMAAGASTTLGSITLVSSTFILAANVPVIAYFALLGTAESFSVALMLSTFTTAMLITTRIVNRSFSQQLSAELKTEQYRIANFQDKIISIINEEIDGDKALEMCLNEICKQMNWPVGHVYWVTEDKEKEFIPSNIWYIENLNLFKPFKRISENIILNHKEGVLGRALIRKAPIWVENLTKDTRFMRQDVAKATGLKSAFVFPIFINHKPVAILEFFNTEISPVDKEFVALAAPIGIQIGRAIERHSNNQSLAESESRFRALIRSSGQGIIVHDNGNPLFTNEEVERIFGYSISQFLKLKSIYTLVIPEDKEKLFRYGQTIANQPDNQFSLEYIALNKAGEHIPLLIRSSVISWDGKDAILSTIVDLTSLRKTEMKLQQKQKMEAVGKLTGGIAHDFNNILMAISGNLELIKSEVKDDKRLSRWTEIAMHGAERGGDLTRQLLLFSKQREMCPQDISVFRAIQDLSLLTSNALPSNINFSHNISVELPLIKVDPSEFDSAIINLIVNSRDAMPNGGSLEIKANCVTITDTSNFTDEINPGEYIALTIEDTGTGISKEIEKKMFDPFFSSKEHGKGFGLGLSSVLGFVQSSGGTITVESEANVGTAITLYFPVSNDLVNQDIKEVIKSEQTHLANGELILVVEDDPSIRSVVIDFLNIKGYKTIGAIDGDAALIALKENPQIDLLLTDIMMPGKTNGIDLAAKYLNSAPDKKAILMTGYSGDQVLQSSDVPKDVIVLRKPFQKNKLFAAIQTTLNKK